MVSHTGRRHQCGEGKEQDPGGLQGGGISLQRSAWEAGSAGQAVGVACAHMQTRQDRSRDSDSELRALCTAIKNSFYRQEAGQGFSKSTGFVF